MGKDGGKAPNNKRKKEKLEGRMIKKKSVEVMLLQQQLNNIYKIIIKMY